MTDVMQEQGKNVLAMKNQDFLCLFAMTGRGLLCVDPQVQLIELSPEQDEATVGAAVRIMLGRSSILPADKLKALINSGAVQRGQNIWASEMSQKFGYSGDREMFRNVLQTRVKELGNFITFSPTRHKKLKGWGGMADEDNVAIPADSFDKDIGDALYEAFKRCTNELGSR